MNGDILFAAPRCYEGDNASYMKRHAFRFVEYFQSVCISTKMVLLSAEPGGETPGDERLVVAPYQRWIDPDFWKAFNVRTVVVDSFGVIRPRQMPPVFRAIRAAGCRVVFQMDTAFGLVRFPARCWTMGKRRYWWARGRGRRRSVVHSLARAAAQTAYWAWGGTFRFMCRDLLPLCDSIHVESEIALENTRKRLRSLHQAETAGGARLRLLRRVPARAGPSGLHRPCGCGDDVAAPDWQIPCRGNSSRDVRVGIRRP